MFGPRTQTMADWADLSGDVNRLFLFSDFLGDDPLWPSRVGYREENVFPAINVWEDEGGFHVEAELPGFKLGDVEILVEGKTLTLKGQRKLTEGAGVTYHRRERNVGSFSRVMRLPLDVNAEKVEAALRDGILTVHLPKAEAAKARKIVVAAK